MKFKIIVECRLVNRKVSALLRRLKSFSVCAPIYNKAKAFPTHCGIGKAY